MRIALCCLFLVQSQTKKYVQETKGGGSTPFAASSGTRTIQVTLDINHCVNETETTGASVDCVYGEGSLHDFQVGLLDGSGNIDFSHFKGKPVLLVNVATY